MHINSLVDLVGPVHSGRTADCQLENIGLGYKCFMIWVIGSVGIK